MEVQAPPCKLGFTFQFELGQLKRSRLRPLKLEFTVVWSPRGGMGDARHAMNY